MPGHLPAPVKVSSPEIMHAYLALAAATASNLQYLRSILNGETRPSLAAMLVFMLSLGSAFASSWELHVAWPVLLTIGLSLVLNTLSFLVGLYRKAGRFQVSRFELAGLGALGLGGLAWALSGNPWVALVAPTLVDAMGQGMVINKLYQDPGSEDTFAWLMTAAAYGLSLAALSTYAVQDVLYAGTNLVLCGFIGGLTWRQRAAR